MNIIDKLLAILMVLLIPWIWVVVCLLLWFTEVITAGWTVWFILLSFGASWSLAWYWTFKQPGGSLTFATMNTVIIWWLLLAWTFHYSSMNKLHLLWIAPSVIPIAAVVVPMTVMHSLGKGVHRKLPAGMWALVAIYLGILWGLTLG